MDSNRGTKRKQSDDLSLVQSDRSRKSSKSDSTPSSTTAKNTKFCHQADSPSMFDLFALLTSLDVTKISDEKTVDANMEASFVVYEAGNESFTPIPEDLKTAFLSTISPNSQRSSTSTSPTSTSIHSLSKNFAQIPQLANNSNFKSNLDTFVLETICAKTDETGEFKQAVLKFLRAILPLEFKGSEEEDKEWIKSEAGSKPVKDFLGEPIAGNIDLALFAGDPNKLDPKGKDNWVNLEKLSMIELKAHRKDSWLNPKHTQNSSNRHLNPDVGQLGKYHFNDSTLTPTGDLNPFRFSLLWTTRDIYLVGYLYPPKDRFRVRWCIIDQVLNWKGIRYDGEGSQEIQLFGNKNYYQFVSNSSSKKTFAEVKTESGSKEVKEFKPKYKELKRLLIKWMIGMHETKVQDNSKWIVPSVNRDYGCFLTKLDVSATNKSYSVKRVDYSQRPFVIQDHNKRRVNAEIASTAHPDETFYTATIKYGDNKAEYLISPWRPGRADPIAFKTYESNQSSFYPQHISQFVPPNEKALKDIKGQLDRLHRAGYVHGDLRPMNIIFSSNTGWIIDFDLSGTKENVYPDNYNVGPVGPTFMFPRPDDVYEAIKLKKSIQLNPEHDNHAFSKMATDFINSNYAYAVHDAIGGKVFEKDGSGLVATSSPARDNYTAATSPPPPLISTPLPSGTKPSEK